MTKFLSVVVPTYNMELYLPQCLGSVTRIDVPSTLEVIVVNDGSKDKSLEIAKRYQEKRSDIIKIIDKPNGHYGSCINAALKVATGKYFRPLDADDWFNTDALIHLLEKLKSTDVDLIITPRTEITENESRLFSFDFPPQSVHDTKELNELPFAEVDGIMSMHSMTYRLETLKKINLTLQEKICYTDTEYYLIPLQYVKKFIYFDFPLYQYRLGREGQSMEADVFQKNRHQLVLVLKKIFFATSLSRNSIEYNRLLGLLFRYYGIVLFDVKITKTDLNDIVSLSKLVKSKSSHLWNALNNKLYQVPRFYVLTHMNLYFYTRIKNFFGIKSLIFRD